MARYVASPPVTICLLTFGDYSWLARRALDSIHQHCPRRDYRLVVGANAVCAETAELLQARHDAGEIDDLIVSTRNISKCPMMRRMFAKVETEHIWWFDDDSYITESGALAQWLRAVQASPATDVIWGSLASCGHPSAFADMEDAVAFVRTASWYRGLPPPSWRLGGGGDFNYADLGVGNGRWLFILGGCFMIRTAAVRALEWPDPRLHRCGDDAFLGEAIRQQGWGQCNLGTPGVAFDTEKRRGPIRPESILLNPL
jgi:hypothetical protein